MRLVISTVFPTDMHLILEVTPDSDAEAIQETIDEAMKPYRASLICDEWHVIHYDIDEIPHGIAEECNPEAWIAWAQAYEEHGAAFTAYVDDRYSNRYTGEDIDESVASFVDSYLGIHDSEEDYAEEYVEEAGILNGDSELAQRYFDYERFSRDLFLTDVYSLPAPGGHIYVFTNH